MNALLLPSSSSFCVSKDPISKMPCLFVVNPLSGALMEAVGADLEGLPARLEIHKTSLASTPLPASGHVVGEVQPAPRTLTEEELKRLREKVAAKMKEKEAQQEIEREARRRQEGRELLLAKERSEDTQMKQLAEQRKKEKKEEEEVRRKIKEQIALDREETARERDRLRNPQNLATTSQASVDSSSRSQ